MANLTRWSKPIAPKWLGNDQDPQAFTLRYKRLSRDELKALAAALEGLGSSGVTPERLAELYRPFVEGPVAYDQGPVALTVDKVAISTGDLEGLIRVAMEDGPAVEHLLQEITDTLLLRVNGLEGNIAGESQGSRGGASTTRADANEDATPAPTAAA